MFLKQNRDRIAAGILVITDGLLIALVFWLAIVLRYRLPLLVSTPQPIPWRSLLSYLPVMVGVLWLCLAWFGAYRLPRRWSFAAAFSTISKTFLIAFPFTTGFVFTLRLGELFDGLVQTPSRLVVFASWFCLWPLLIGGRWAVGRMLAHLYRQDWLARRTVILGDGPVVDRLRQRLAQNDWLGEKFIGRIGWQAGEDWLGEPSALAEWVACHQVDVIWLVVDEAEGAEDVWLPPLLLQATRPRIIWRMLPDHFAQLVNREFTSLTETERGRCFQRLQHHLPLPTFTIAMIGSRGVPANYGGVERYVEEVGAHLVAEGASVAVYCHSHYISQRGQYRGMELRFVPTIPGKNVETLIHTLLATFHALLQDEEIFHYHALGPSTLAWLPRLLGRNVVVTVQGLDWQRAKWGRLARFYLRWGEWSAIRLPHETIVVSQALADYFQAGYGLPAHLIPNGYTLPTPRPPSLICQWGLEQGNYLLFVGRLVPEKGCHTLIEAFTHLCTDYHLVVAGRAGHERRYQQKLRQLAGNNPRIHFVGYAEGAVLQELYSNAYLVVHPSEMEGLSIVVLEALSYGNCLLVSDLAENVEAAQGLALTFVTGSVEALTEQLQRLCDDPERVAQARGRVRSQVQTMLAWAEVAQATERVYAGMRR